jgi:hypothetical protein
MQNFVVIISQAVIYRGSNGFPDRDHARHFQDVSLADLIVSTSTYAMLGLDE